MYKSPVPLITTDATEVYQCIGITGSNKGATYDSNTKSYHVNDKIILKLGSRVYQLLEYHFHTPGCHTLDGKSYDAELHFVFAEPAEKSRLLTKKHRGMSVIQSGKCASSEALIISRLVKSREAETESISSLQVRIPSKFFQYDGSLSSSIVPIRWLVGTKPIHLDVSAIEPLSRESFPINPMDNRILLLTETVKL